MTAQREEQAAGAPASDDQIACPRCGAEAAPDQLLCVECGERLGLTWRRPPTWRLPAAIVGIVVLLAGAALALALAEVADDAEETATAPVPTAAATVGQPPAATTPEAAPPAGQPAPAEAPPAPQPESAGSGQVASWPEGTSAYTVVLMSAADRAAADARAEDAVEAGVPAGVLQSDDYSSLKPGYWVVYGGQFDSNEQAQQEAERFASLGFPGGYPRFVNGGE